MNASDQLVGQIRDEAHGVGEEHRLTTGKLTLAGAGIERHKEAVFHLNARVGEGVQHRRLAGVGVAHQGHFAVATAVAALALDLSRPVDLLSAPRGFVDAMDQAASINLELGLARSPRPDPTGLLGE